MARLTGVLCVLAAILVAGCEAAVQGNNADDPDRTLVLLAATSQYDPYYGKYVDVITNFQIEYAKRVSAAGDNVIVLAPPETAPRFRAALADGQVLSEEMYDTWIRDFGLVRINKPTALVLGNKYMTDALATSIQSRFLQTIKAYCPSEAIGQSTIVSDGGNVVDNFVDTAVVSRRILKDNPTLTENQIRAQLLSDLDYQTLAFIPDSLDKTGHADGMVSFIDTNQLAITGTMREQPELWEETMNDLKAQAPKLYGNLLELKSLYKEQKFDGFDSSCGLHVNALLTGKNLFVPVFGHDPINQQYGQTTERDQSVVQAIRAKTSRQVVEVPVPNEVAKLTKCQYREKTTSDFIVCRMGGSVRCLSAGVQGPLAQCLVRQAQAAHGK